MGKKCENNTRYFREEPGMELKKKFVINAAFYGIILVLAIAFYRYILPILLPFIIGFCIAAIVQLPLRKIPVKSLHRRKLVVCGLVILFYGAVVGLLALFSASIVNEVRNLVATLPDLFQNQIYPLFSYAAHRIEDILAPIDPKLADWIMEMGRTAAQSLGSFATNLSAGAVKLVANSAISIPGILIQIILTVVASFYFACDYRLVTAFLKSLIPQGKRHFIMDVVQYAKTAVVAFIKSYSVLFVVTFVELWIGLSILKIPYSLAIAFGIALFDLMPVLGTGGILLPWVIIALLAGNYGMALGVGILYIVITVVRNALEPRIVGGEIGLHPLATLLAMMLGLGLLGLVGMLLFPITLVALNNIRKATRQPH